MRPCTSPTLQKPLCSLLIACSVWILSSCATPLDMSQERMAAPGPEWGIVIGSVLVREDRIGSSPGTRAIDPSMLFEFDVVQIQPRDPDGDGPHAARYQMDATAGQERSFLARLRPGRYLIKNFYRTGLSRTGGDLNLVFESQSGRVVYIGQLLIEVPPQLTRGKEYRFSVQDAHETTFSQLAPQHGALTQQAMTVPMQIRPDDSR